MVTTQSSSGASIISASVQHIGSRENQEDAYGHFSDEFFVVADGMGGQPHGEVASQMAVERAVFAYEILRKKHFYWQAKEHLVAHVFKNVSRALFSKQPTYPNMGTTMVAACFSETNWWIGNVGDSRAYLMRDGVLQQITTDHNHGHALLTRWIPMEKYTKPDQFSGKLQTGDIFLLASDGLNKSLSESTIHDALLHISTPESAKKTVADLVTAATHHEGSDNITICLIKKI